MFTIIGADGNEYGPVPVEQVRAWIDGGRANYDTQARRAGTEEWRKLREFTEFGGTFGPAAEPPPIAAAPTTATPLPTGPVDAKTYAADLIARTTPIDVFDCLLGSFELWKRHFFPLVGGTLLVLVAQFLAGLVPIVGMVSGLVLNGIFYGGLYDYYLGHLRGEERDITDAFAGFKKAFVPLMLATVITSALSFAILIPFVFPSLSYVLDAVREVVKGGTINVPPSPLMLVSLLLGGVVMLYFSVCWIFTFILVIDQGLRPWTALEVSRRVVNRQWFRVFFLLLLAVIVTMIGLIGFIVGILFTLPIIFGAIVHAYERICNPRR